MITQTILFTTTKSNDISYIHNIFTMAGIEIKMNKYITLVNDDFYYIAMRIIVKTPILEDFMNTIFNKDTGLVGVDSTYGGSTDTRTIAYACYKIGLTIATDIEDICNKLLLDTDGIREPTPLIDSILNAKVNVVT